jgi:hypothetical protein
MTREEILKLNAANPPKNVTIQIPEWGNQGVTIRELSAAQARIAFSHPDKLNTYLFIASVIDGDGKPVFADTPEDVVVVDNMPHTVVRAVTDAANDLNQFSKTIEERQKNSEASLN